MAEPKDPPRPGYDAVMIGHFLAHLLLELKLQFFCLVNPDDTLIPAELVARAGPYAERYGCRLVPLVDYAPDVDPNDAARLRAWYAGVVAGEIDKLEDLLKSLIPPALALAGAPAEEDAGTMHPGRMRARTFHAADVRRLLEELDELDQWASRLDAGDDD
jgi:hypothetical protein